MKKNNPSPDPLSRLEARYRALAQSLAGAGFISQGSVFQRKPGHSGSRYQWSWKDRKQKTKSLTLSLEQFQWLKNAIHNHRQVDQILKQMRRISHQILIKHMPGTNKRKPLKIRSLDLK